MQKVQSQVTDPLPPIALGNYRRTVNHQFWRKARVKYGPIWVAKAPVKKGAKVPIVTPRPTEVDHAFSAPLVHYGERYYAFTSEAARDAFVAAWPMATVCQDPLEP